MNTISSVSNSNVYNPQITNKVAAANSANLANNAANQSAFSSYIGQALAQIGVANPTNSTAPVVSGANKASAKEQDSQKTISTFIQDLFSVLSNKGNSSETPVTGVEQQVNYQRNPNPNVETPDGNDAEVALNEEALAAYGVDNTTTVGNIVGNLQTLVSQLNDTSRKIGSDDSSALQFLKDRFQTILDAQGANSDNPATLGNFLQALAQNLEGQSPLGLIFNTTA